MTIQVTDAMVSRFLGWKLPEHFAPDCGVTFYPSVARTIQSWPTGTNLLTADQARAMLEHVLGTVADGAIKVPYIELTPAEIQSGLDRVRWAETLIKQLPEWHDGRNSWLLNYGSDKAERQAEWAKRNQDSALARAIETKIYPDGTIATGPAPLPEKSPIDLGEVTGCQKAPSMIGENAPDLHEKRLAQDRIAPVSEVYDAELNAFRAAKSGDAEYCLEFYFPVGAIVNGMRHLGGGRFEIPLVRGAKIIQLLEGSTDNAMEVASLDMNFVRRPKRAGNRAVWITRINEDGVVIGGPVGGSPELIKALSEAAGVHLTEPGAWCNPGPKDSGWYDLEGEGGKVVPMAYWNAEKSVWWPIIGNRNFYDRADGARWRTVGGWSLAECSHPNSSAPDLRPTETVEAATLGETKAEQQTAHQLSDSIEAEIVAKGLTAPRVTPTDVEAAIASEHYFTANDGVQGANYEVFGGGTIQLGKPGPETLDLLTFCVLVLRNGFTVTGESACASPENFDAALGRKIARQNAVAKVWPLLGYALRERLASGGGL